MTEEPLSVAFLRKFLDQHSEITVKLTIHIAKQGMTEENLKLFDYYIANCFNQIIEDDMKPENIDNMNENIFFISHNKHYSSIKHKGRKNMSLVKYNLQELVTAIKSICTDKNKLLTFLFF